MTGTTKRQYALFLDNIISRSRYVMIYFIITIFGHAYPNGLTFDKLLSEFEFALMFLFGWALVLTLFFKPKTSISTIGDKR